MPRVGGWRIEDPAWSEPALRHARYSQSLERGLAILRCYTGQRPVLSNAGISEMLQMERSTTHRYITTLVALGYLEHTVSRKYRLGLRVGDLGFAALDGTGLREQSREHLEELCEDTGCTTSLGVLNEQEIVYVDHVHSLHRQQRDLDLSPIGPGSRLPAYCTAAGKLLLAHLPVADRDELIDEMELTKHAPNTITSKRKLLASLQETLQEGFAVEDQELAPGRVAIAAPVRDGSGEVLAAAALTASTANTSVEELLDTLSAKLGATAERISARLDPPR